MSPFSRGPTRRYGSPEAELATSGPPQRIPQPSRRAVLAGAMVLGTGAALPSAPGSTATPQPDPHRRKDNLVLRWNQAGLDAITRSTMGPPMVARGLAILQTCVYDAWAAYDRRAAGTRLGTALRQPAHERTPRNKNEAISYAAYTAAVDLWPASASAFNALMAELGYPTVGKTKASAVGVQAAKAVLDYRHHDGANQLGDLSWPQYSDYTGYKPVNSPMDFAQPMDLGSVKDPNRWQPLIYTDPTGVRKTQTFTGPQFGEVPGFALTSWNQFRLPSPARFGSHEFLQQAQDLIRVAAQLTDKQKVISEFWADEGPGYETPAGTWSRVCQFVSHRDHHSIDDDAKMFFVVANAAFDACTFVWGTKREYDSVRPVTAIRYLFHGKQIPSYSHAGTGPRTIDGAAWLPYQPVFFATPSFPEYPSGHSAHGAAAAEVLKLFTGSDAYGGSITVKAGSSRIEPGISPQHDIRLFWPTFSAAQDENAISRIYGGIHFEQAVRDADRAGRLAGRNAFAKAQRYFHGFSDPH